VVAALSAAAGVVDRLLLRLLTVGTVAEPLLVRRRRGDEQVRRMHVGRGGDDERFVHAVVSARRLEVDQIRALAAYIDAVEPDAGAARQVSTRTARAALES
jgi:hypothetical protein